MRASDLSPRDQARLAENLRQHFAAYGFRDQEEAAGFLARAKVRSASRKLQIGAMFRLPDGSVEGFSGSFP